MTRKFLKKFFKFILFIFLSSLEGIFFLLINSLPNKFIYELAKKRYKFPPIQILLKDRKIMIKTLLERYLLFRINIFKLATTCLSRSLISRLVLDLIGLENQINFSIIRYENGFKQHHSWINCIDVDVRMMKNINHRIIFTL